MKIRFFSPSENIELESPSPSALSNNQHRAWSESEKRFLRDNWETKSPDELANLLGRTRSSIQCYASKVLALKKSPEAKYLAACRGQQKRKDAYTEAEKQYIRENWQLKSTQEIADVLGRTRGSVKSMGQKKMGLKKTAEAFRALVKRPNAGQFKKGNLPQTTIYSNEPVIRPRHHARSKRTYLYIRLTYGKWQQYHQWMWIRDNGPIPPGHIVVFRNGDQMDVRPENLELITMKENRLRNSGSLRLSDGYVAHALAWHNPELQQEMLKHPELIELKRTELKLKRAIKHHDNAKPTKTR